MYRTVTGPSHSKRRRSLPCTRRWLRVLPVLRLVLVSVLLLIGLPVAGQRWRHQQRGRSVGGAARPRWSPSSSSVTYTPDQVRALTPYRTTVESRGQQPELRDLFLCHAWDDRRGVATELNDLLEGEGVSVWFSEKDILLGQPFMREIDRGLAKSRTGLVLLPLRC